MGKEDKPQKGYACWLRRSQSLHNNAERHYEAELHRLKGELLLQQARDGANALRRGRSGLSQALDMARPSRRSLWSSAR